MSSTAIDDLHKAIYACEKCSLSEERCLVVVKRGSNDSKIMVIGDAPGEQEDTSGIPFVGDCGALLEKIFQSVGLDSEQIYISNIVKCKPPDNRKPTTEEIKACKPWLLDQIALVKPKILVLLGAAAYTSLFGDKWLLDSSSFGITKHRGKFFVSDYCTKTICTFHPSYLLRNHSLDEGTPKYLVWQDWMLIVDELENAEKYPEAF